MISRRDVILLSTGMLLHGGLRNALAAAPSLNWTPREGFHKQLPRTTPVVTNVEAVCRQLKSELANAISAANAATLGRPKLDEFRSRAQFARVSLQRDIHALQASTDRNERLFIIQSLATVIAGALTVISLAVASPYAIGALVGIQFLSVAGFNAWSIIESPSKASSILIGHGRDRAISFVGLRAQNLATASLAARYVSMGTGVFGTLLTAWDALSANREAQLDRDRLDKLIVELNAFETLLNSLPSSDRALREDLLYPSFMTSHDVFLDYLNDTRNCSRGPARPLPPSYIIIQG